MTSAKKGAGPQPEELFFSFYLDLIPGYEFRNNQSCSWFLKILASATNVPKGSNEAINAIKVILKVHRYCDWTIKTWRQYAMNKIPCPMPITRFGVGIS